MTKTDFSSPCVHFANTFKPTHMACFSVQYCKFYAVLIGKCAVLNLRLCSTGVLRFSEI